MRALFAVFFCALACAAAARSAAPAQNAAPKAVQGQSALAPPQPGFAFPQKQTLTYAVDWRVFPAGIAVIRSQADGNRERVWATGRWPGQKVYRGGLS